MKLSNSMVCFFFLIATLHLSHGFEKRWIRSNSWNDPENWNPPQLPCPNDNIVIKEDIVYIEKNVTVNTQLNLPINGEIVFGANTQIELGKIEPITMQGRKRKSITCSQTGGVDRSFVGQKHKEWLNPLNWEIYSNGKRDLYLTKAAPFIERVPCFTDSVSFPDDGAFKVSIVNKVTVKDIKINNNVVSDNGVLQTYLKSREGSTRFNFVSPGQLKLDSTISDSCLYSWCKCWDSTLLKSICKHFTCPKREECAYKVRPLNDCCSHCGALVKLNNYESDFDFSKCWAEIRKTLSRDFVGVRVYMYPNKSKKAKVEMLLSEDGDGAHAVRAADYISEYISNFTTCGKMATIKTKRLSKEESSKGGTVALAVILTLIILALLGFGFYYFKRKRTIKHFKSQRFDNENDFTQFPGVEDVETDLSSQPTPVVTPGTTQFANPLYELRDLEDNENKQQQIENIPSPEYAIPVRYFNEPSEATDVYDTESTEPRYVEQSTFSTGLKNPSYSDDLDSKFDPDDIDAGNENPLYAEIMKESSDKNGTSEADLDCTDDTQSIGMKLELKLGDSSDSEAEYGNQFQIPVPNPLSPPPIPEREATSSRRSVENLGFIPDENNGGIKGDLNDMSEC